MVEDKKKWNGKSREEINEYHRRYYQKNKAKHLAMVTRWKKNNPEKVSAYAKKLRTPEFIEKKKVYYQEWRNKNKEQQRIYHKAYRKRKNEEKLQQRNE